MVNPRLCRGDSHRFDRSHGQCTPPKLSVLNVVGYLKGKSAIAIAVILKVSKEILRERLFGWVDILFQPLVWMKLWLDSICAIKKKPTRDMISLNWILVPLAQ
jgi:hypothetical protein